MYKASFTRNSAPLNNLLQKYAEKVRQRGRIGNVVFSEGMDEKVCFFMHQVFYFLTEIL